MVLPIIAARVGGKMAKKVIGKAIKKTKIGKAVSKVASAVGFGKKTAGRKYRWTIEKGMKQLVKAKIQGKINKYKYGWIK